MSIGLARSIGIALLALLAACASSPDGPSPRFYAAIVGQPDRSQADRDTDKRRNSVQLLAFTGVAPGMKVLDMGAGGGYSTELLARAVGPRGAVYAQHPPGILERSRDNFVKRARGNEAMGNVQHLIRPFDDPLPPGVGSLDLVTFLFFYHDTVHLAVDRALMNRQLFAALKPGGILVLADHSARDGAGTKVTQSLHRIEERVVREELEAAGFQLVARGDFLRNSADERDVHVLKSKIPNDEFVLKFRKPH